MGNQFTNIFSNYKLERVKKILGGGCYFTFLLDQKGKRSDFIHTFFLTKKYAKTQGRTMLLPTGFYAGPPFGRAMAWGFVQLGRGSGFFVFRDGLFIWGMVVLCLPFCLMKFKGERRPIESVQNVRLHGIFCLICTPNTYPSHPNISAKTRL